MSAPRALIQTEIKPNQTKSKQNQIKIQAKSKPKAEIQPKSSRNPKPARRKPASQRPRAPPSQPSGPGPPAGALEGGPGGNPGDLQGHAGSWTEPWREPFIGGPRGPPGKEKVYLKPLTLLKILGNFLTRKFSHEPRVGFRVRAIDSMHQDDSRQHMGRS